MNNIKPFFSICIPQYRRPEHLICALQALVSQSMQDFEVCISDDGSPEVEFFKLESWLKSSGLKYNLVRQSGGLRYDKNLRAALALAKGEYCLLMGNDDALYSEHTLEELHQDIKKFDFPAAIISNFCDWQSGEVTSRVPATLKLDSSVKVAANNFRNQAFVSGLLLKTKYVNQFESSCVDGSEMYQMYLFAATISGGGDLLLLKEVLVKKDIQISNAQVDSYATLAKGRASYKDGQKLPMLQIASTVMAGIIAAQPELTIKLQFQAKKDIVKQLYLYTYRFWIVEYRRIHRLQVALGLVAGMSPFKLMKEFSLRRQTTLLGIYIYVVLTGLLIPVSLFSRLQSFFYKRAKKIS